MTIAQAIQAVREAAKTYIDQRLATLFGWTLIATSSAMGDRDAVQTEDGATTQRPVQRIEQWGLRARAPAKMRGFWVRMGSSNVVFLGILPTTGYGPVDAAEGETVIYNLVEDRVIKLDLDGVIHLGQNGGLGTSDGLVHGSGRDPFSRLTHEQLGNVCSNVRGKKT